MLDSTNAGNAQKKGKGVCGRILHVDLSSGKIEYEILKEEFYKKYLSGVGLAAKVLWDRMKPGVDPLGPENILGFATGILTGTGSLFAGRFIVVGKSPMSGGWGDSNCGGYFAPSLKRCGIDALFFYGESKEPVYLYLDENRAEIKDASDLWGKDTIETEDLIKKEYGKRAQVACIGAGGEKMCLFAGISTSGGRIAARGGLGCVMGSKKLKAVVAFGKNKIAVADKSQIVHLSRKFSKELKKYSFLNAVFNDKILGAIGKITRMGSVYLRQPPVLFRILLKKFGTPAITAMSAEMGDSPIKNWGGVGYKDFPLKLSQNIGAEAIIKYEVKKYGCYSCPIKCGGIMKVADGPYKIDKMHKPEYETICAFGSLLLNDDIYSIFKINDLANRGGIDTISCGSVIAFAIECFENNIITKNDTNGLSLAWGDSLAIIKLVEMIINREGIGDILANGVKKAAQIIGKGADKYAVHCGGVELPMHDPKFDPGFAISYYCEPTPGRHTITAGMYMELQRLEKQFKRACKVPLYTTDGTKRKDDDKGKNMAVHSFYKMIVDCAGLCFFGTIIGGDIPVCGWLNAATGWDMTNDDFLDAGERIEQLRHAFNIREGINPIKDFKLHPRATGAFPQSHGPLKNVTLNMDSLSESFYKHMNWDIASGKPEKNYLEKIGLSEVADTLYPEDK